LSLIRTQIFADYVQKEFSITFGSKLRLSENPIFKNLNDFLATGFIISAFSSIRIFSMMIATMSIAVEAGIAKIYTAAPEIDYFCYQLSPDSFNFHNIEKYSFSFTNNSFSRKTYSPL